MAAPDMCSRSTFHVRKRLLYRRLWRWGDNPRSCFQNSASCLMQAMHAQSLLTCPSKTAKIERIAQAQTREGLCATPSCLLVTLMQQVY